MFNIDLQDFFGTVNFGRVRGFFVRDRNFALHPDTATVLAQIACYRNSLPQGSPCSPVISNLIGHLLDIRLGRLAFDNGCTYSRYADDITFSTNKPDFPSGIARPVEGDGHKWEVGDSLRRIVTGAGFAVNPDKTRMQYRTSRQDVTGLVVNDKVNVRSDYRRTVRAMAHRLFRTGKFEFVHAVPDANGVLVPTRGEGTLAQLHGMFGHINSVDHHNAKLESGKIAKQQANAQGVGSKENLYRRFLIFKEFYVAEAPVIVCEGKTDNVYVRQAIRKLASRYPGLATVLASGKVRLNIRIPRYSETTTGRVLGLRGGTANLNNFVHAYKRELAKFAAPGGYHPVILLVDNDDGAEKIFSVVRNLTGKRPTGHESFTRVIGNLYLVVVPPRQGQQHTAIEHAFSEQARQIVIGGKTLSLSNDFDTEANFGKVAFAKYVEQNAARIDFSGFAAILDRLAAVINAHGSAVGAARPSGTDK